MKTQIEEQALHTPVFWEPVAHSPLQSSMSGNPSCTWLTIFSQLEVIFFFSMTFVRTIYAFSAREASCLCSVCRTEQPVSAHSQQSFPNSFILVHPSHPCHRGCVLWRVLLEEKGTNNSNKKNHVLPSDHSTWSVAGHAASPGMLPRDLGTCFPRWGNAVSQRDKKHL